jgi:hypothetical protein
MTKAMLSIFVLAFLAACDRGSLPAPATPAKPSTAKTPAPKPKPTVPAEPDPLYTNDFKQYKLDAEPDDWILDGPFTVRRFEDGRVLKLTPTMIDDYVALANPMISDAAIEKLLVTSSRSGQIRARIHTLRKGRRLYSRFGVGLGGDEGFKLLIAANAGQLQLWHNDKLLNKMPFKWASGQWAHLRLVVFPKDKSQWVIQGKAWQTPTEPDKWMIGIRVASEPPVGRPALWGTPYAGKPIYFDDVIVSAYSAP